MYAGSGQKFITMAELNIYAIIGAQVKFICFDIVRRSGCYTQMRGHGDELGMLSQQRRGH